MATKVKLRSRKLQGGRSSLYLDFYPPIISPVTGKSTRREFLDLYVFDKPRTPNEKKHNSDSMQIGEQFRFKRENEILKADVYSDVEKEMIKQKDKGKGDFIAFMEDLAARRKLKSIGSWTMTIKHLKIFHPGFISFNDIDKDFCFRFRDYILSLTCSWDDNKLMSNNTTHGYLSKFKSSLVQAYREGYTKENMGFFLDVPGRTEGKREFLSMEELNLLAKTECKWEIIKKMAFFSAMTGLRYSDVAKLVWREVVGSDSEGWFLDFTQNKTGGVERLPISAQTLALLGDRKGLDDRVFVFSFSYNAFNPTIKQWCEDAGIFKHITFHCFRHSFATNQLTLGTDITTVSKMLGHRDLSTTMIYAKVVDSKRREAANRLVLDL